MNHTYLGLGSNLGNKKRNLEKAISLLPREVGKVISVSSFYESVPWGFESENNFLNAALLIETSLSPSDLLVKTKKIEKELGRKKKSAGSYSDRIIDIDILFYNDLILNAPELKIPHPLLQDRDFVLIPLAEIAPDFIHPKLKKSIKEMLAEANFKR